MQEGSEGTYKVYTSTVYGTKAGGSTAKGLEKGKSAEEHNGLRPVPGEYPHM
jgi:hypothetical protein